ncbi:MAG TPA: TonB-dependent receptor [Opitutaceae bacterium]
MYFRTYILLTVIGAAPALLADPPPPNSSVTELAPVVVTGQLDEGRDLIMPSLGATSFIMDQQQILNMPQGQDAPFSQVLLRAPGVAEDSSANGNLHVRGEHANLQYRINDVLLPEGVSGFGLELDPRFVSHMQLITGSLPAQYGFRTAGIVDITTKNGTLTPGGEVSLYTGSFDTVRPSFEASGTDGKFTYFADGSYEHNSLGIENPTSSGTAIHDLTDQYKAFAYLSYVLTPTSRLSFMGSAATSAYEIPDTPGLPAGTAPDGAQWVPGKFDSSGLNENQNEQNFFAVAAYQVSAGDFNGQLSAFARESSVHFVPDAVGDLYFNGVASDVSRRLGSLGLEGDSSYSLPAGHMIRAGFTLIQETVADNSTTTVFPVDPAGDPTGPAFPIGDHERPHGLFAGAYLQDEWKLAPGLTLNWGARLDAFDASFDDEGQLSPRVNLIYKLSDATTLHAGYARYFTPPPVEDVPAATVAEFNGTSNQSAVTGDDPVKAERADYLDAGVSQKIGTGLRVGLDGYYKRAHDQLDDGLFGQTFILSSFNYARGEIYGAELSASYDSGGFDAYANLAHSVARGEDWDSAQFLFSPEDLAYVRNHWIFLDHDQALTASFGASYHWKGPGDGTRVYIDLLTGTGLRTDAMAPDGTTIPNGGTVPSHYTLSAGGERSFRLRGSHTWKLRVDLVNLTDDVYEIRSGTGVGVNAPQYGMRLGAFGSVSYAY